MGAVRPYLQFARLAFQRRAAYRLANFTGVAVNFFFLLVHAQVLLAFFRARGNAAGWAPTDAVLYFATSESLLLVIGIFPDYRYNLAERVRTGEIVSDLVRPVRPLLARARGALRDRRPLSADARADGVPGRLAGVRAAAAAALGARAVPALARAGARGVGGALVHRLLVGVLPREARRRADGDRLHQHVPGGVFVPLDFYPPVMRWIADVLPFRATLYTPVAISRGSSSGDALVFGLAHQVVWAVALGAISLGLESRGLRRLATQGG